MTMIELAPKDRIIVALDVKTPSEACNWVYQLRDHVGGFKLGLEFITAVAVRSILGAPADYQRDLASLNELIRGKLFWDGKWDDIPNTVKGAAEAVAELRPLYANVHASAGLKAVQAAVDVLRGLCGVLGVTVLTSLDPDDCRSIFGDVPGKKVLQFARTLKQAGAQGIICSPLELKLLERTGEFSHMEKVVPGIRDKDSPPDDQNRTMTPGEAIHEGATKEVIGRLITGAKDPVESAKRIAGQIEEALKAA